MASRWYHPSFQLLIILAALFFLGSPKLRAEPSETSDLPLPESQPQAEAVEWQPTQRVQLKLNLPATRLDLYVEDQLIRSYPVAIGMPRYPTPPRDYHISMIIWNPWWIPPDSDWAKDAEKTPPGPGNPLGVVKMIMEDGIRIHGTNAPRSIGRAASHACLRMRNEDARELAWEIQSRYSEKNDPTLLDKYQRNRRQPYYVKLLAEVPVAVEYQQVERQGDRLLLHPNLYGRGGFQEELTEALTDHPEILIDKEFVKKLNKMRRGKTAEIRIQELGGMGGAVTPKSASPDLGTPGALNTYSEGALGVQ